MTAEDRDAKRFKTLVSKIAKVYGEDYVDDRMESYLKSLNYMISQTWIILGIMRLYTKEDILKYDILKKIIEYADIEISSFENSSDKFKEEFKDLKLDKNTLDSISAAVSPKKSIYAKSDLELFIKLLFSDNIKDKSGNTISIEELSDLLTCEDRRILLFKMLMYSEEESDALISYENKTFKKHPDNIEKLADIFYDFYTCNFNKYIYHSLYSSIYEIAKKIKNNCGGNEDVKKITSYFNLIMSDTYYNKLLEYNGDTSFFMSYAYEIDPETMFRYNGNISKIVQSRIPADTDIDINKDDFVYIAEEDKVKYKKFLDFSADIQSDIKMSLKSITIRAEHNKIAISFEVTKHNSIVYNAECPSPYISYGSSHSKTHSKKYKFTLFYNGGLYLKTIEGQLYPATIRDICRVYTVCNQNNEAKQKYLHFIKIYASMCQNMDIYNKLLDIMVDTNEGCLSAIPPISLNKIKKCHSVEEIYSTAYKTGDYRLCNQYGIVNAYVFNSLSNYITDESLYIIRNKIGIENLFKYANDNIMSSTRQKFIPGTLENIVETLTKKDAERCVINYKIKNKIYPSHKITEDDKYEIRMVINDYIRTCVHEKEKLQLNGLSYKKMEKSVK